MNALLAALRISRRGIGQARARSALIMVMIGLPVLLLTVGVTWQATGDVTTREGLDWNIGAADAHVRDGASNKPVKQSADGSIRIDARGRGVQYRNLTEQEVLTLFGPGSRVVPSRLAWTGYQGAKGYREHDFREIDLRDPITKGMYKLLSGRLPRAAGEVAASPGAELREGSTVTVSGTGAAVTVVGVVEPQREPGRPEIVALPGTVFDGSRKVSTNWLIDTPAPVSWQQVREMNRHGVAVFSREVVDAPPSGNGPEDPVPQRAVDGSDITTVALGAIIIGLEVVLLAGPAFAVGIRRRRRELALIAAQGGSPRHLRGVVLADGLTLGFAASLLGAAGGIGIGAAVTPLALHGPFEAPIGRIAIVVLLGVVSALLAAVVPAVQASRTDVAEVLAGRRGQARERRGLPVLGLVLLSGAIAIIVIGPVLSRRGMGFGLYQVSLLAGAVLGQLGLVLLTPWLVGAAARLATRLPLPFRMAARDAARNRGRTAPAVAAVLAATAVFAGVAVVISSQSAQMGTRYEPQYLMGSTVVTSNGSNPAIWREIKRATASALPGVSLIEAGELAKPGFSHVNIVVQPGCTRDCPTPFMRFREPLVGGADLARYFLRGPDPVAEAALAAGKAVVFDPRVLRDGMLVFTAELQKRTSHSVPAVVRRPQGEPLVSAILPVSLAAQLGLTVGYDTLIVDPAAPRVTPEQEARLDAAVRTLSRSAYVRTERGFQDGSAAMLLALALGAAVLVLGGTFAATGLAAAEGRPDRATLAAVGATGLVQRLLVAGQAAFVSGLGVAGGMLIGLVFGVVGYLSKFSGGWVEGEWVNSGPVGLFASEVDVPWLALASVLVGLPLLAALMAALCVRTKVLLTRRHT
ncbi:FtsX-like permease family protein [Streptosporangium sp. NBC_01756]|uniref:FtsX-like permease family protein n=1 Tax=Streptosporangium sp. NBC_01756 TaxID=2975950 RepID=UPI002DDA2FE1|nr:FtsX-like permease family protein [Streptosporangium sp. NBC_01756]WSC88829.1 ABC transporter permease [Streptosporangium sp. NBC_01756]